MIKIEFEKETEFGVFRDALYLEEEHQLSVEQIEALKQERIDNWLNIVKTSLLSTEELDQEQVEEQSEE